jgi:protein-S-isoprenylcysteine O-methyltransferase Ste14
MPEREKLGIGALLFVFVILAFVIQSKTFSNTTPESIVAIFTIIILSGVGFYLLYTGWKRKK